MSKKKGRPGAAAQPKVISVFATIHHDHFADGEIEEINRQLQAGSVKNTGKTGRRKNPSSKKSAEDK